MLDEVIPKTLKSILLIDKDIEIDIGIHWIAELLNPLSMAKADMVFSDKCIFPFADQCSHLIIERLEMDEEKP